MWLRSTKYRNKKKKRKKERQKTLKAVKHVFFLDLKRIFTGLRRWLVFFFFAVVGEG